MVWSVAGLLRFSPQSMQNETATQTAESAIQSSNCVAMTATQFLKQKLVPGVNLCGLFVDPELSYMGATPDGVVSCDCCGKGVVELKCPFSISHQAPSADNLPYLCRNEQGRTCLKKSHHYYDQCQGQLVMTSIINTKYCDFFVYTMYGSHCERILLDLKHWSRLQAQLCDFFSTFVVHELVTNQLADKFSDLVSESHDTMPKRSVLQDPRQQAEALVMWPVFANSCQPLLLLIVGLILYQLVGWYLNPMTPCQKRSVLQDPRQQTVALVVWPVFANSRQSLLLLIVGLILYQLVATETNASVGLWTCVLCVMKSVRSVMKLL